MRIRKIVPSTPLIDRREANAWERITSRARADVACEKSVWARVKNTPEATRDLADVLLLERAHRWRHSSVEDRDRVWRGLGAFTSSDEMVARFWTSFLGHPYEQEAPPPDALKVWEVGL